MNFVPCATWVRRGVSREVPEKVTLTKEELKSVMEDSRKELEGAKDDEVSETGSDAENSRNDGSEFDDDDSDVDKKYNLDKYDEEENTNSAALSLAGLSVYASNDDDPYITLRGEPDSDEEDFIIKPDDNIVVVGRIEDDSCILEFCVYNDEHHYIHHDTLVSSPPLCIEWLDFDPGDESAPGNLVAVGSMKPVIDIWDIDVVESLEPDFKLGKKAKKKKKKDKNKDEEDSTAYGHKDAVLDLSWNRLSRNVLASGSADQTVILWDLTQLLPVTTITAFEEKVQSIQWHPCEAHMLLTGSCDKSVRIFDCRTADNACKQWTLNGEVERVLWNHFNPFYCLASTDQGFVYCLDARTSDPLWTLSAHTKACSALSLSESCPGFLVTSSTDKSLKVWDIVNISKPAFVSEVPLKLGRVNFTAASPDDPFTFCFGGDDSGVGFDIKVLNKFSAVKGHFNERALIKTSNTELSTSAASAASTSAADVDASEMEVEDAAALSQPSGSSSDLPLSTNKLTNFEKKKKKRKKIVAKKKFT